MNRRTAITILVGLAVASSALAGVTGVSDALDEASTDIVDTSTPIAATTDVDPSETNENLPETMSTEEFTWGTVTHETDPETGETHVEITVENEDDVSISMKASPEEADYPAEEESETASTVETETFAWGTVTYAVDPDTGETDIEVLVEAENDVSLSVTTISEDGTRSESTIVHSAGETDVANTDVSVSQSSGSSTGSSTSIATSSTSVSQTSSVTSHSSIDSSDEDD